MDSIHGISSFVRVVVAGSFSAAARQLDISPAAVSRNVQRLERKLGVRLLHRTTRQVALTDEGRVLFETSHRALAELEAAHEAIAERGVDPRGLVRVTTISTFGRLFVLPLLGEFHARCPHVRIELHFADRSVDMIEEGFDVGIGAGAISEANIVARKLADVPRVTCGAPAYLTRHPEPRTPQELAAHDCIRYRSLRNRRPMRWEFGDGAAQGFDVAGPLTFNDMGAVCDAALAGLGLAQLPSFIATPHVRAGRLKPVLTAYGAPTYPLFLYYPAGRLLPARVRAFVDFTLARVGGHPDLVSDARSPGSESARRTQARIAQPKRSS